MKDINGVEIEVGDLVRTQQKPGGVLPPGPAREGVVYENITEHSSVWFGPSPMLIKFRKEGQDWDTSVCLHGQINEVIKKAHKPINL